MIQHQTAAIDFNTIAAQAIVPAVAGKRIAVHAVRVVNGVASAQSVIFASGGSNLTGVMQLAPTVGSQIAMTSEAPNNALFLGAVGSSVTMSMTAATQVGGVVAFRYL